MEKKKKTILLFFIFVVATLFFIRSYPAATFPKNLALDLSRLPLKLISLSFLPADSLINCNRSLREARALKKENQELKIRLMLFKEVGQENKRLRELLSFKQQPGLSLVAAKVIYSDVSNFRRSLVIDKGKNYGIKLGNPVITSEGMVGMVIEVGNLSSRIILINDTDFSMAAKVERSGLTGIISGSLEGTCKLKYLDLDDDIKIGDEVISSGRNSRFPAGIPIGRVVNVSKDNSGLNLFAIVRPKARLSSLQEVLVIINY